jgi:spore maturation protein CgeB
MKLVIFGLSISSSWGNGHATLWRGLLRALAGMGHTVVFFERDVVYYANHRDMKSLDDVELILYPEWNVVRSVASEHVRDADVAMVTSYCPDAQSAAALILDSNAFSVFYDLDSPVTLARVAAGAPVPYLPDGGLGDFDLVLSYAGGVALSQLQERLGARTVAPLYGHADPAQYQPVPAQQRFRSDLSYLGTYAPDRQAGVEQLFIKPAQGRAQRQFLLGGSNYPPGFPAETNVTLMPHVAPPDHPAFYCSSRATLSVTREAMASLGFCPSGRLFEAAACGVPVVTDDWPGLPHFYTPNEEIIVAHSTEDVIAAIELPDSSLARIGRAARERTLDEHSSAHRARELLELLALSRLSRPERASAPLRAS